MTENDIMKLFLKEISKNKIKERIEKNKFLFSEYPTKADASFFAILIQFFETPSNIKSLKDLFKLEGYLSEDDTKTIKILNKYIQNVKESLGYGGGKWEKLTDEKEKWPLNYDFDYSKNCNELKLDGKNDKYNGPFNLETGDLDHFVELFDEEIENDEKYKLSSFRYVEEVGKEEKYYKNNFISRFMLTEAAAYICNMGKDKSENDGKECKQKHINEWDDWKKINKEEGKTFEESLPSLKIKTRELVNEAINEENKRLISQRVHEAVKEAVNLQKIEQKEKMGKNKKGNKSEGKEEEGKFEKINLLEEE
uniref:GST_C_6 domain-containing protein n=1 Tax=Meloidogyne hapla TaxID=6305 RepID=A0A1I8BZB9_MELHA